MWSCGPLQEGLSETCSLLAGIHGDHGSVALVATVVGLVRCLDEDGPGAATREANDPCSSWR